jgi:DNA-binding NtrC family response regulator
VLERAIILESSDRIEVSHLPVEIQYARRPTPGGPSAAFDLPPDGVDLEELEKRLLLQAMERTKGNQSQAARLLRISRYALRYRLEKMAGKSEPAEG